MDKQVRNKTKRDVLLLFLILAAAGILFLIFMLMRSCAPPIGVVIKVDGNVYWSGPLSEDTVVDVTGFDDGYNRVEIHDGVVYVSDADCPDKICINTGRISITGDTIVCLPHRMVVEITGDE